MVGWEDKKVVKSDNTAEQSRGRYWWHQNIHVIHLIVIMTIKFPWYSFHHVKSMHVMDSPVLLPFSKSTATKSIRKKEITRWRIQVLEGWEIIEFHPYETKPSALSECCCRVTWSILMQLIHHTYHIYSFLPTFSFLDDVLFGKYFSQIFYLSF